MAATVAFSSSLDNIINVWDLNANTHVRAINAGPGTQQQRNGKDRRMILE